ncbi:MAG: isopropylmalate isomerase [Elusimicrobia bacterium RIFCSPLOWO2_01_FULL_64_13]|nr:MAG: isopropylmalate isomerase [Elusimicrobia bacterium RIFCSPHIGHO2_01_FULL_64_10]OGR94278.1 MAG: isopropylmalate isomerase [Elusimicrobia bacterium RIFCSPLOWO2_01_FULL_64_13]
MALDRKTSRIELVEGRGIPLPGNDIDTDRIIPARFMKCVTFDDLAPYVFYDARFGEDGSKKDHPFNDPRFTGASILIVGRNFGCGSSREHAPQALYRSGIRGLVGESFAEIFSDNCAGIGLPIAAAAAEDLAALKALVAELPRTTVALDLERRELRYAGRAVPVAFAEQARRAFLEGSWDSTRELLSAEKEIRRVASQLPYLNQFRASGDHP